MATNTKGRGAAHRGPGWIRAAATLDGALGATCRWTNLVGVTMILAMMGLTSLDVALRYFFRAPLTGAVEVVEFLLVLSVFLGLAHTQRVGANVAADLFIDRLPPRVAAAIDALTGLLALVVTCAMAWGTYAEAMSPGAQYDTTDMLEIPIWPFKLLASIGIALLAIQLLAQTLRNSAVAAGLLEARNDGA